MTNEIKSLLEGADRLLENVFVSGTSAYMLVDARRQLKAAYDLLKQEENDDG